MDSGRKERAEITASAIRKRWGTKAMDTLRSAASEPRVQTISSGFADLDHALGIGGIPRCAITEISGVPTSGIITIALKAIAKAQEQGDSAAYLDLTDSLDADYATRCGVDLTKLLLIRPRAKEKSLDLLYDLIAKRGAGVVVFDSLINLSKPPHKLVGIFQRINRALAESGCALIFVNPSASGRLSYEAAVRLLVQKKEWLHQHGNIRGYLSQITILKNDFAPAGRETVVRVDFDQVVLGDAA